MNDLLMSAIDSLLTLANKAIDIFMEWCESKSGHFASGFLCGFGTALIFKEFIK